MSDSTVVCIVLFVALNAAFVLGHRMGRKEGRLEVMSDAVSRGHGRWVQHREFMWGEDKEK